MSQSGKVLRLYVEVRSSPEHDLKSSSERNLDGPVEALKKFAEEATSADACRALRPNVSFQLQPSGNSLASPQRCAVQPQEPLEKPSSGLENKFSSHRTPGWVSERRMACRACSQTTKAELRQKSVVTFSYIEKPQIKTVKSPCSSPSITCQALACSHQKYSDPICSRLAANRSPKDQHKGFPAFSPSTYNLTGQLATQRALKEFGSPQLRCRFSQTPNRSPEFCQQQRARCQSWEGSQMPTYYSCRHDSSCCSTSNALPGFRSQACPIQQLYSAGDGQNWESEKTCLTKSSTPGLNQLSGSNASSALNSPEVARKIAEEASKVSAIFNEARIMSPLSGSPQKIHHGSPSEEKHEGCSVQLNIPVHELQLTQKSPSNLVSLPTNHGCALPEDLIHHPITSVLSRESCTSPALPSRFIRPSQSKADVCSPLRDPRQLRADLPVTESPTLHRHKPPQYTGEEWTSGEPCFLDEEDWDSQVAVDSAEISRRLFIGQSLSDSPVSWTSRQQWKEEANVTEVNFTLPERHKETLKISSLIDQEDETVTERNTRNLIDSVLDVNQSIANKEDEVTLQQKQAEWRRRQALLLGPVVLDEDQGFGENQGLSGTSPSSSGVTGSLGDRDCLSPEFSHQSDHPSSETQQDGGFLVPSLHCQKIARAKWEFLFGPSVENSASVWEKTPQSVCSTVDSSMLQTVKELRPRANQHVQHIEVELGTRPPVDQGKSGKISQTLKYSETNLDTVPRRCYCETNIDEVLLTEQEDADSAFGSNRSVMGSSPMGEVQSERTDKVEEEEEEEDVASWITVRMQGDMRRLRDEEPEFYREMLRSSKHTALKSPVLVRGPSRRSRDSLDTFSRHFENIVESFRAKGTSYSSLDSLDPLTVLTFDLPTLSPRERPAPLARVEVPSTSESALTFTADTDATRAPSSERLSSGSDERNGQSWHSGLSRPLHREEAVADIGCVDQVMMEVQDVSGNDALSHRGDLDAAKRLANRLFALDGFRKCDVARHLSKKKDFSRVVAEEYLQHFNFSDISLDQALRTFLTEFGLTGETQERETILSHFSRRFVQCNSCLNLSEDSVHTLTCALMLLNADLLDNKAVSLTHFSRSLEGLNSGRDFPKDLLKALYNSIKNEKLQWTIDEEELRKSFSELGDPRAEANCGGSPSALYKTGFLVRKVHADCDGKRTPRGKRGWKTFYAVLKGLVLYLRKGENRPDKQLSDEDLKNAVSIHHSLAIPATDYSKRPDVFYLRTADWRVYLFQAPNAEQMQSWITRINTVAAMFSTPPLHAAIGSQKKFSRPLLPGTASKLSQEEQVQAHESRFRSISSELTQLRSDPPERKVKGRDLEEYRMRAEYLEFEKTRCETYSMLLRAKQRCGDDSLSVFELMLVEEGALPQTTGSTPSLQDPQDIPANSNAQGQRHSYRQAVRK